MYVIIYIFYNNLGIRAAITHFYCMLKERKKIYMYIVICDYYDYF